MRFEVTIDTSNAAFGDDDAARDVEISRILIQLAKSVRYQGLHADFEKWPLRDANGNKVGHFQLLNA